MNVLNNKVSTLSIGEVTKKQKALYSGLDIDPGFPETHNYVVAEALKYWKVT